MKLKITLLYCAFAVIFFSCKKDNSNSSSSTWTNNIEALYQHNAKKLTITQGVAGTLTMRTGNCMPIIGPESDCKEFPVQRTLFIYEYTTENQTVSQMNGFFTKILTKLVAKVETDKEGFFEMKLDTGTYSIFIYEKEKWYANSFDGLGGINPVTILAKTTSKANQYINYAVY